MLKNIINKIKARIIVEIKSIKSYKEFIKEYKAKDKEVIIISSIPTHGNIGDHAILCAEIDFLKDNFPTKDIVLLPSLLLKLHPKLLKMFVKDDTIIAITGGGFLGSLWMYEEKAVRNTIKSFKNNKIIIMPQTIFFDNNEEGIKEKSISKKIYNSHPNLTICTREEKSYNLSKEMFPDKNVLLIPDMVLYLKYNTKNFNRKGTLLCMRRDKEKTLSNKQEDNIYNVLEDYCNKDDIKYTDTVVNYSINKSESRREVNNKIDEFSKSELVITDRLHGMILAAIAGTPCIAFGNSSGKVKGVYMWIEDIGYVSYLDNLDDFESEVNKVLNAKSKEYNNEFLLDKYNELISIISE